jgi:hypothetical protein
LLCAEGRQFPEPRDHTVLDGIAFNHPKKGKVDITIDADIMARQGRIYAGDADLRAALQRYGVYTGDLEDANEFMQGKLAEKGLILGVSGFAMGDYEYSAEAEGMVRIYDHLSAINKKPSLAIDGGISAGSLGLSGVIAKAYEVPTLGVPPRQGLANIGDRDHLVVWGNTYRDREVLVGTLPDMLVCVGGAAGSRRECQEALKHGSTVLLLALKDYFDEDVPHTYENFEDMRSAANPKVGRLVVCETIEAIPEAVDDLLKVPVEKSRASRTDALNYLLG